MSDSSDSNINTFDGMRFSQVRTLLNLIKDWRSSDRRHVKRLYLEQAEGFDKTVAFAINTHLLKEEHGGFTIRQDWPESNLAQQKNIVTHNLFNTASHYRSTAFHFINRFRVVGGDLKYFSSIQDRSAESSVRNFLIELGL